MKWRCYGEFEGKPSTVFPIDDLREHDPDDQKCWCRPRWDEGILVHNSMDGREAYEEGRLVS
jgi:hypothetical protein